MSSSQATGRVRSRRSPLSFLILGLLGAFVLFAKTSTNGSVVKQREDWRRKLQLDEIEIGDILDALGGLDLGDEDLIFAGAASLILLPITAFTACVTLITGAIGAGAIRNIINDTFRVPSSLTFELSDDTYLPAVDEEEQYYLVRATELFYNDFLSEKFPNDFESIRLEEDTYTRNGRPSPADLIWNAVTGNTRKPYGYELKFEAHIKVRDTEDLTLGRLINALYGADMSEYVTEYVQSTVTTLSNVATVTYADMLQ